MAPSLTFADAEPVLFVPQIEPRDHIPAGLRIHEDAVARDKMATAGLSYFFPHLSGHHVGFRYHDPGFPIAPGVSAKLEPGMVITISNRQGR